MYLKFYKLKEFPFTISCDEKFFYESPIHAEALANMMYTVQQRKGMVLITGEVGAGKTFLSNLLASRLGPGCLSVLVKNPPQSGKQLLRALAQRVGMNAKTSMDKLDIIEELEQHLIRLHARGRLVALLLDECQDLSPASLEEIRLLWNWEHQGQRLVQIVLTGQPELRKRFRQPQWEPLRQRIVLTYHLGHMQPADTYAYVQHRLKVAAEDGGPGVVFTPEALQDVHAATDGIPRLINILCDNALLVGYAKSASVVDRSIIAEVLRDMTCWDLRTAPADVEPDAAPAE